MKFHTKKRNIECKGDHWRVSLYGKGDMKTEGFEIKKMKRLRPGSWTSNALAWWERNGIEIKSLVTPSYLNEVM